MRGKIRFVPVAATGTTVEISDGTTTDTATQQPEQTGLSVSIETDRNLTTAGDNFAPCGYLFKATPSGFSYKDVKELRFKWTFNDPDAQPFTAPKHPAFDRFGWRDSNIAYTRYANHVFAPPVSRFAGAASRDYTVTCEVRDRLGNVATGSITVRVDNPDSVFSISQTKVVAHDNDFTGLPSQYSTADRFTTYMDAFNVLGASGGRILLKRGGVYTNTALPKNKDRFLLEAWGSDPNPPKFDIIAGIGIELLDGMRVSSWSGFDMEGDWDVLTETSPTGNTKNGGFGWQNKFDEAYTTVYNLGFRKINNGPLYTSGGPDSIEPHRKHIYISNINIESFRNYAVFVPVSYRFGMSGVKSTQDVSAAQGGKRDKSGHAHTNMRVTGPLEDSWNVFDAIDMLSVQAWTNTNSYENTGHIPEKGGNNIPATQSCVRWNPGNANLGYPLPAPLSFSRFVMEGGNTVFLGAVSYNSSPAYGDIAIDKGVLICGSTALSTLGFGHEGVWASNLLLVAPKMKLSRPKDFTPFINVAGTLEHPARIWGCTAIVWLNPTTDRHEDPLNSVKDFGVMPAAKTYEELFGNVVHAPNLISPIDNSANLSLTERIAEPRWPGMSFYPYDLNSVRLSNTRYVNTDYAAQDTFTQGSVTQASVCLPVPSGTGLRANGEPVPVDDIFGNIRPTDGTEHKGAIEPTSV